MSQPRKAACELLILGVLTTTFLVLFPRRPIYVDAGLGLLGLSLVLLTASHTWRHYWSQCRLDAEQTLQQNAARLTWVLTGLVMLLFLIIGIAIGHKGAGWPGAAKRILHPYMPLAFVLYFPWTWLQQTLFQFYLLSRLRVLCGDAPPLVPSTVGGFLFGAVHLPDVAVAVPAVIGGTIWSALYLQSRRIWPLAVSHALVGTTFYYWVYGLDLAGRWSALVAGFITTR